MKAFFIFATLVSTVLSLTGLNISSCLHGCSACDSDQNCYDCLQAQEYIITSGQCSSIDQPIPLCTIYAVDLQSCVKCSPGYKVDLDTNTCVGDSSGCIDYEYGTDQCNSCGFGTSFIDDNCVGTYMCSSYDQLNTCTNCFYGYQLNSTDSLCYPDLTIQVGCVQNSFTCNVTNCLSQQSIPVNGGCWTLLDFKVNQAGIQICDPVDISGDKPAVNKFVGYNIPNRYSKEYIFSDMQSYVRLAKTGNGVGLCGLPLQTPYPTS